MKKVMIIARLFAELNETLNFANAFNTNRRDASNPGLELQENHGSVLQKNLSRRLNSLVSVISQDRELVITRTPSRSIAASTPIDSANPSPKPLTPGSFISQDSRLFSWSSDCSEISSLYSEVIVNSEPFFPELSYSTEQPTIVPLDRNVLRLTREEQVMDAAEEEIVLRSQTLTYKLEAYPPDGITDTDVDEKIFLAKLEEIDRVQEDLIGKIDKFLYKFPQHGSKQYMEDLRKKSLKSVLNYKSLVNAQISQVKKNMTSNSTASLVHERSEAEFDLKRREVEAMERANTLSESQTEQERRREREKSVLKAKSIYDNVREDVRKLDDKITKIDVDEWSDQEDNSVSKGMRNLEKWEKDLKEITKMLRSLKDLKNTYNIEENEVRCEFVERDVAEIEKVFNEVKEKLETEDEERGLYSMEKPKTSNVNFPTFSGKDCEDFSRFQADMEDGFKTNRVSRKEQIHKLRECLRGQARKLIPDSNVTDVNTAWDILKKAYGNPIKIIKQRKDALLKLGEMPHHKIKGEKDLRAQISWFIDLTTFLKELIELGKKNSKYKNLTFSEDFAAQIRQIFPTNLGRKLRKCDGEGQELFENMLDKIEEFRDTAQEDQQDIDITKPTVSQPSRASGNEQRSRSAANYQNTIEESDEEENVSESTYFSTALIAYKPSRRDERCRVCRQLEEEGDTTDLYDEHLHNYPSGCPRYIQMNIRERSRICYEAKICMKCHDPEYVYQYNDDNHEIACKQSNYTCRNSKCSFHMWVCVKHQNDNEEALEKFKNKYEKDHKLNFGLLVYIGSLHGHIYPGQAVTKRKKNVSRYLQNLARSRKNPRLNVNDEYIKVLKQRENFNENNKGGGSFSKKTSQESKQSRSSRRISCKEATRILRHKLAQEEGSEIDLKPVPKGRAQFMIGQTKGKSGPLNILYDSGCYALLLKEGVQKELRISVLKTKGPFYVKGVGNTTVKVNDEWMTSLPLLNGSRQAVEGWTVDEVTGTLPNTDLTKAVTELKDDDKKNTKLQGMFVELVTGGQVDILLGTMYNAIFPIPVHSLPTGLTIYELQVRSHDGKVNSVIGGPHESFEKIAAQTGGYNLVFSNLVQSLENYRNFGPPSVPRTLAMGLEDDQFSNYHKEWEMMKHEETFEDMDCNLDDIIDVSRETGANSEEESPGSDENNEAAAEDDKYIPNISKDSMMLEVANTED